MGSAFLSSSGADRSVFLLANNLLANRRSRYTPPDDGGQSQDLFQTLTYGSYHNQLRTDKDKADFKALQATYGKGSRGVIAAYNMAHMMGLTNFSQLPGIPKYIPPAPPAPPAAAPERPTIQMPVPRALPVLGQVASPVVTNLVGPRGSDIPSVTVTSPDGTKKKVKAKGRSGRSSTVYTSSTGTSGPTPIKLAQLSGRYERPLLGS